MTAFARTHSSFHLQLYIFSTDCPPPKFTRLQPRNFTAVEGYNVILKYSFDGADSLSSPLRIWVLLPHSQGPVWLNEFLYPDCGCLVKHQPACSVGTNPNDFCRFELIVHTTPHVNVSGTKFCSDETFIDEETVWMCKYTYLLYNALFLICQFSYRCCTQS